MKTISPEKFWEIIEVFDNAVDGVGVEVDIDLQDGATFTEVTIDGRPLGREMMCHASQRATCWITHAIESIPEAA